MGRLLSSSHYSAITSTVALATAGRWHGVRGTADHEQGHQGRGVKRADLATSAVDSRKVADGSLKARDFGAGQAAHRPPGGHGPSGTDRPTRPCRTPGTCGSSRCRWRPRPRLRPDRTLGCGSWATTLYLFCPDGLSPTGGGLAASGSGTVVSMHSCSPSTTTCSGAVPTATRSSDNGWGVQINNEGTSGLVFAGYAVCGSATTVDQEYVVVTPTRTTTETTDEGVGIIARPG